MSIQTPGHEKYIPTQFILSQTDINELQKTYECLNVLYHRYDIQNKRALYIDSNKGEFIPFLSLKHRCSSSHYYHSITDVKSISGNALFYNIANICYLYKIDSTTTYDVLFTNQISSFHTHVDNVASQGFIFYFGNANDLEKQKHAGIEQIYQNNELQVHCFKKLTSFKQIKRENEFQHIVPIKNPYHLIEVPEYLDVNVCVSKVSKNRVKINVLRFDSEILFHGTLKLKLYAIDSSSNEVIVLQLNNSSLHCEEYEIVSFPVFKDEKLDVVQKIPKIICQTLENDVISDIHMRTVSNLKLMNPEYKYVFFDSKDRRAFIKEYYDTAVLDMYDGFVSGAFKADIFRYCWLYINGGCYVDCKMINRLPFREVIKYDDETMLCKDRIEKAYQNCVIGVIPKQLNILNCILECVNRFEKKINHRISFGSLYHTGPYLFYYCMSAHDTKCKFVAPFSRVSYEKSFIMTNDNKIFFNVFFKDYYENYLSIHKQPGWSDQWAKHEIYYSAKYTITNCDKFSISIYPNELKTEDDKSKSESMLFSWRSDVIYNDTFDMINCYLIDEDNNIERHLTVYKGPP